MTTSFRPPVLAIVPQTMRSQPKMTDDKPRRRWYQYSLRTLLLLMLLVSVGMSLVATRMRAARRQRDAVAAIKKSGGWVTYSHDDDTSFPLPGRPPPGPLWLRRLLGDDFFTTVEGAYVESDADFECLERLDQLKRLRCGPEVTEAGLAHLKDLRHLRDLDLMGHRVAGAKFEHITALTELEDLNLSGTDIGDAELERLKTMSQLHFLGLVDTKISDAGLRHLEGLDRLEELLLNKTQIGDTGVEHLKGLTRLKRLGLGETRITDAALECLTGLKNLQRLGLQFTNVSAEGVTKIEQALPDCDIRSPVVRWWHPGEIPTKSDDPFTAP
jgi:hypothetical protein